MGGCSSRVLLERPSVKQLVQDEAMASAKKRSFRSEARSAPHVEAALKAFGIRVKEVRSRKRITQERLARTALIGLKHIQLIEAGKANVTLATIAGLAAALEEPMAELMPQRTTETPEP